MWAKHNHRDVLNELKQTLKLLEERDPATLEQLARDSSSTLFGMEPESRREAAIQALTDSIRAAEIETTESGHEYHSRDPLTGVIQSRLEDSVMPEIQATGQGNPIVWIPAGIKGILEHFRKKYPFQTATAASRIEVPENCKIALISDWGAPNEHARRIGELAISKGAQYLIHLGDIYFSGSESECQAFIERWPLKDADGKPKIRFSFTLNGNHEMYSLGIPYFTLVLPNFGQEASYFTLFNKYWQFQALDTAYVPFSIGGGNKDSNLRVQYEWLKESISSNPDKQNIFLSHNQPVSAHLPEFEAAQPLMEEARGLLQELGGRSIYAWFFGHEHRCTIYKDPVPGTFFRARLIGNGAIPHHKQEETSSEKDETKTSTTPLLKVNSRCLDENNEVAVSTFALLTLDGKAIHVEYFDEDDRLFYEETWVAPEQIS